MWDRTDQAVIDAVEDMCGGGRISPATWAVLSEAMDRQMLMDLIYSIGFFAMNVWAVGTMGVPLEPDFAEFSKPADEMVAGQG